MIEWLTPAAVWGSLKAVPPVAAFVEKYRLSRVARDLAVLRFWNDGMTAPLKRIADGNGRQSDLDEIAALVRQTQDKVAQAGDRLRTARDNLVSTNLGMAIARDLDVVVYEKLGPGAIRPRIRALAASPLLRHSLDEAKELLSEIDAFNRHLDTVHEAIRPKARQPSPNATPRRRSTAARAGGSK
jgi:hypothetical protein